MNRHPSAILHVHNAFAVAAQQKYVFHRQSLQKLPTHFPNAAADRAW
jgi:hypothetical protein